MRTLLFSAQCFSKVLFSAQPVGRPRLRRVAPSLATAQHVPPAPLSLHLPSAPPRPQTPTYISPLTSVGGARSAATFTFGVALRAWRAVLGACCWGHGVARGAISSSASCSSAASPSSSVDS